MTNSIFLGGCTPPQRAAFAVSHSVSGSVEKTEARLAPGCTGGGVQYNSTEPH
jgi:hypothetical protein